MGLFVVEALVKSFTADIHGRDLLQPMRPDPAQGAPDMTVSVGEPDLPQGRPRVRPEIVPHQLDRVRHEAFGDFPGLQAGADSLQAHRARGGVQACPIQ